MSTTTPARKPSQGLPALSVRQPWAGAIVTGAKDIENRSQRITRQGWVLIHASQTPDLAGVPYIEERTGRPVPGLELPSSGPAWWLGSIVGAVFILGHHHHRTCRDDPGGACSPWALPDLWHLKLTKPVVLTEPVPARGQLGLWYPTPQVRAEVRKRWPQ